MAKDVNQIKDEIKARDALIGIDEEDEQAHHHDFDDDEDVSHVSSAGCDDGIDDGHHNQSVDSERIGKRGTSRSHRHNNISEMQSQHLADGYTNQG